MTGSALKITSFGWKTFYLLTIIKFLFLVHLFLFGLFLVYFMSCIHIFLLHSAIVSVQPRLCSESGQPQHGGQVCMVYIVCPGFLKELFIVEQKNQGKCKVYFTFKIILAVKKNKSKLIEVLNLRSYCWLEVITRGYQRNDIVFLVNLFSHIDIHGNLL